MSLINRVRQLQQQREREQAARYTSEPPKPKPAIYGGPPAPEVKAAWDAKARLSSGLEAIQARRLLEEARVGYWEGLGKVDQQPNFYTRGEYIGYPGTGSERDFWERHRFDPNDPLPYLITLSLRFGYPYQYMDDVYTQTSRYVDGMDLTTNHYQGRKKFTGHGQLCIDVALAEKKRGQGSRTLIVRASSIGTRVVDLASDVTQGIQPWAAAEETLAQLLAEGKDAYKPKFVASNSPRKKFLGLF